MSRRPGPRSYFENFGEYEASLPRKFELATRNTWRRIRRGAICCGNPGEPGC